MTAKQRRFVKRRRDLRLRWRKGRRFKHIVKQPEPRLGT